ncbi:hypothetical protein Bca4012_007133 [Brassica carinata]
MDREEEVELIMGLVVVLVPVGSQHYRSRIGRSCDGEDGAEQEEEEEEKEGEGEKTET